MPSVGPPRPIHFPPVETIHAGGLRCLLARRRSMPILDLHLLFRHGATEDPAALAGCAAMIASTLDTGTRATTQNGIAERLDALGTALAVQTAWDHSSIGLRVLSDRLEPALHLLAELVREAAFPEREFDQRRQLRIEAILQERNEPDIVAGHAIARAIYGTGHPYGRPHGGTRATIERLTRDDAGAFHRRFYVPGNAFLLAVGDTDGDSLQRIAESAFGGWAATGTPEARTTGPARTTPEPEPIVPGIRLVDRIGAPQSEFRIGTIGAERTSHDYFALLVLNTMLGGSFSSRLNTRLREERGFTYGAFSRFAFRRSRGPFVAGASVDAEATHLAIADTIDVIHAMGRESAGEDEVERARRYLSLGLVHGMETNAGVAARIAEVEVHGLGAAYYEGYVDRIRAVTAEQVREVAARYLDRAGMAFAVVGDGAAVRRGLEGLDLGPVVEENSEI